ncbi:MAG: GntR family transcriptional regulator [Sphingopyxis sp.]|nr:GntR family transcriptional regulator [Sphingopyxis sp.]
MSPDAVTAERLYRDLKRGIMLGAFPPGGVLVTSHIAGRLGTSVTPVRDVLHQLVGEGLIATHDGGGFIVPAIDRERMAYLYRWHGEVMGIIIRNVERPQDIGDFPERAGRTTQARDIAGIAAILFARLASLSGNPEHATAIDALGARLHLVRCHEHGLGRCRGELQALWHNVRSTNKAKARTALWQYHRRRLLNLDKIMRGMGSASQAGDLPNIP